MHENGGLADLDGFGRRHHGQVSVPGKCSEMRQDLRASGILQFLPVSDDEFREQIPIMAVPFVQGGRRGDALLPFIEIRAFLAQPTRPQPIHQHPRAISPCPLVVRTTHPNVVLGRTGTHTTPGYGNDILVS
jgi:hypothetical protein